MKKLKLELDALKVETFEAERTPEPRGTVQGNASSGGGGDFGCENQCVPDLPSEVGCFSGLCFSDLCASEFGCPSDWECISWPVCGTYEVINCGL